jgi:hypothetical protein
VRAPRCLECHAPAHGPAPGISCETCHGPAGGPAGYFGPHAKPEFYAQADRKGLKDLYGDARAGEIAQICIVCHVLDPAKDKAIAELKHPTGADFDVGRKLEKMKHWPSNDIDDGGGPLSRKRAYAAAFYAKVSAAGKPEFSRRLAGLGAKPAAGAGAATAPAATAPAMPAKAAAAGQPTATRPAPATQPATSAPAADPFFAESVPEYVPGSLSTAPDAEAAPARPAVNLPRPAPARPAASGPAAATAAPVAPAATVAVTPEAAPASVPAVAPPAAAPAKPSDDLALRGQAAQLLSQLLKTHAGQLALPKPLPAAGFKGPGSELRRLQDEALALALEALRRPE